MTGAPDLVGQFEAHRGHLRSVAVRMLGTAADADDVVQEAWLRLSRVDTVAVVNLRAWLTTVTARLCLDLLRSRSSRREEPLEVVLPNATPDPNAPDPAAEAELAEQVSVALYVVLDALSPAERLTFVLHDLFGVPLSTVATTLGRTPNATKQLALRARTRVRDTDVDLQTGADRTVVDAFFAAGRSGDFAALVRHLDPAVELHVEGVGLSQVLRGADGVAGQALMFARSDARLHPARVGDDPGVIITVDAHPISMMAFTVSGGLIRAIHAVTDQAYLRRLVPTWVQ